jgi:glucosamine-6-phosphate deaminase
MTLQPHKIVVFSPHPDDDVISMGGTIKRLVEQGNDVHVVYMTSGSNGVFDFDAKKYFYFLQDLSTKYMF